MCYGELYTEQIPYAIYYESDNACPLLNLYRYRFLGLHRLEYRGYDSAGLGLDDTSGSQTLLIKTLGKVAQLQVKRYSRSKIRICLIWPNPSST